MIKNKTGIRRLGTLLVLAALMQLAPSVAMTKVYADNSSEAAKGEENNDDINKGLSYIFPYLENGKYYISPKKLIDLNDLKKDKFTVGDYENILSKMNLSNLNKDLHEGTGNTLAALGGKVWDDLNGDGIQDTNETLLKGIDVSLLDQNKNVLKTTKTDIFGRYSFDDLNDGTYFIRVNLGNGYDAFTKNDVGTDNSINNDFNNNGITKQIEVKDGNSDYSIDCGLLKLISIGDFVWNDKNWNGIYDDDENGLGGIQVNLFKDDNIISKTVTDSSGHYKFNQLIPGKYSLQFVDNREKYIPTEKANIKDKIVNVINSSGKTTDYILRSGDVKTDIDAGFHKGRIGNIVFEDKNFNGIKDKDEYGIEGVEVKLYLADGTLIKETKTDSNGRYEFNNISPGSYYVRVIKPEGYNHFSPRDNEGQISSNVNSTGKTDTIYLSKGENFDKANAGLTFFGEIVTTVWNDKNSNGVRDENEKLLKGVQVSLLDSNGNEVKDIYGDVVRPEITDEDGSVYFIRLPEGKYKVNISMAKGYNDFTKQNAKINSRYSNVNSNGFTDNISVSKEHGVNYVNAGMIKYGSILNKIWNDRNRNGRIDKYEEGLEGIEVSLYDGNDRLISLVETNKNGEYKFDNLEPGNYYVKAKIPESYKAVNNDSVQSDLYRSKNINIKSGDSEEIVNIPLYKDSENVNPETVLPQTSKSIYNYILYGSGLIIVGAILITLVRRK